MTELPPELQHIGLGARTFKKRSGPENKDRSIWTDTPADRERKARVIDKKYFFIAIIILAHILYYSPYFMYLFLTDRNALREKVKVRWRKAVSLSSAKRTWRWQRKCLSIM